MFEVLIVQWRRYYKTLNTFVLTLSETYFRCTQNIAWLDADFILTGCNFPVLSTHKPHFPLIQFRCNKFGCAWDFRKYGSYNPTANTSSPNLVIYYLYFIKTECVTLESTSNRYKHKFTMQFHGRGAIQVYSSSHLSHSLNAQHERNPLTHQNVW